MACEKGNLTISRRGNGSKEWMEIKLEDDSSTITFIEIKLSLEDMMKVLTNQGQVDCEYELRGLQNVGKQLENKTEYIEVEKPFDLSDDDIRLLLIPYEVDGWMGRRSDMKNHHRFNRQKSGYKVEVNFSRFVERE